MDLTKFSLNAGEMSDDMAGRIDLQKVQMGLETAENVRVLRVGGVTRRAGFRKVAPVYDQNRKSRLKGFRFSAEQGYTMEFSHLKMRVIRNGKLLINNPATAKLTMAGITQGSIANLDVIQANQINGKLAWSTGGGGSFGASSHAIQVSHNGTVWVIVVRRGGVNVEFYFANQQVDYPWEVLSWRNFLSTQPAIGVTIDPTFALVQEYTTPWTEDQIMALHFAQRIDRIIVTHGDVETHTILRNPNDTWVITPFPWQERVWEVYETENPVSLTPTVTALNAFGYINASAPIFSSAWVGTRLRLANIRPEEPYRTTPETELGSLGSIPTFNPTTGNYPIGKVIRKDSNFLRNVGKYAGLIPVGNREFWRTYSAYNGVGGDYDPGLTDPDQYPQHFDQGAIVVPARAVRGAWSFETSGTWRGTFVIERSYDNGVTWNPIKTCQSNNDKNFLVQDSETLDANAQMRVIMLDLDDNRMDTKINFTTLSVTTYGIFRIDTYSTPTQVQGQVERKFESAGATTEWYEDAFNPKNGYAKTCTFHQKRLWFGGSKARTQTVWASRTRKPFDFTQGTLADDGMSFETDATEYESVLWLVSHLSLLVGTTSGIWAISSPNGMSVTPENNANNRNIRHGVAEGIPGVPIQNNVLFLQSKGRKIQELVGGSVEYGGYTNVDLTQLASHITRGGVVQMESGDAPDSTLYLTVGGQIAILTYERAQNVVGWSRFITEGYIESAATCTGRLEDDDLYAVVERSNGRFIEWMTPDMLRREEDMDMPNLTFLDSFVQQVNTIGQTFNTILGLSHLEGMQVQVYGDGEDLGPYTVADGKIVLNNGRVVNNAIVGLPYTSLITTMPLESGVIGMKGAVTEAIIRFRNSLGMEMSMTPKVATSWSKVEIGIDRIEDASPAPLVSGDAQCTINSTWKRKPTISVRQTGPYPMTILAVRAKTKSSP